MIHDHTIDLSRKFCPLSISAFQKMPVIQHTHDTAVSNNPAVFLFGYPNRISPVYQRCAPKIYRIFCGKSTAGNVSNGTLILFLIYLHASHLTAKTPVTSVDMTGAPFTILNSKTYECPPYCSSMCLVISSQCSSTYLPIMGSYIFPRFRSIST